ncbi:MAG: MFS transporter [Verrucomicrobia bacterium]|nr:MFS transporter [Verrucomicrobiota bacterium]
MNPTQPEARKLATTDWLIILVAIIGFVFDTYELLMLPVIAGPALAEILQVPANNPLVTRWVGNMLWITALCGGIFGLLGGWLTDRLGRKTVLAGSIMVYSLSPVFAAFSTSLPWFLFFRCTTFVGVCVEFVAAITWLAELFPDKRQKELVLGGTQAFASVGGLLVTFANILTVKYASVLPGLPLPEPFNGHSSWRYTLMTGLLPAIPIALLLPFVPESQVWLQRRKAGTLRRPSILELFSPQLRRVTLVTAGLSACAYGAAFGALQMTPTRIAPGLPDLAEQRTALKPLRDEATGLNKQLDETAPRFAQACVEVPGLKELAGRRAKVRVALGGTRRSLESADVPEPRKVELRAQLGALTNQFAQLEGELNQLTAAKRDAKKALADRERILGQLAGNRGKQEPFDDVIKKRGNQVQLWQEMGGLSGRIALALLLIVAMSRRTLLRLFLVPGVVVFPLTYLFLFQQEPQVFKWGMAMAGFLTVAQFSYFGEYLPKMFPLHLRGTGGSFATNVGGRMFGTSAAFLTANLVAPRLAGTTFEQVATAAAIVGTAVFVIGLALSFFLPEPKTEPMPE